MILSDYNPLISTHTPAKGVTYRYVSMHVYVYISTHTPAKGVT